MGQKPMNILLLEAIHPVTEEILKKEGFNVRRELKSFEEDELIEQLSGVRVLGIRSKTQVTKRVIEAAQDLMMVGAFCIGTDQVDLMAAKKRGIPVYNAPYSNTRSVAELVLAELIALSRQLGDRSMKAHRGVWEKSAKGSREVRGKILGIVGYGHIGSQLSIIAESLGLTVIFYDIVKKLPLGNARQVERLEDLLRVSDFVSLHVPDTALTKNMIGERELGMMKKGSHLVNASRGTVVEIRALAQAIQSGHIAGAAVDVFPVEPIKNDDVFSSELQGLPNVILTPHVGGSTEEAQEAIGREVADSIINFVRRGTTLGAVNFPRLDMPPSGEGTHRVLNVHQNTPGVLRDINKIVSDMGANIVAQALSTDPQIGYLLMDMEKSDAKEAANRIKKLPTSIRTRVLY